MGIREFVVGNTKGKTAWQHLKDSWATSRAKERWQRAFDGAFNPLGLKPGNLVDLGLVDEISYEVDAVIWYHTPDGSPDYTRYGLAPLLGDGPPLLLEAMPGEGLGELLHTVFEHLEDLPLDDAVVAKLESDVLVHERDDGSEAEFCKDFETKARVFAFGKDWALQEFQAFCYAFFDPDDEQSYVSIDALDAPHDTASAYAGRAIDASEVQAIGTAQVVGG